MKRFKDHQRIRVFIGPLAGECGTVGRLRYCDDGAWVRMDRRVDHPDHSWAFPEDDPHGRGTDALLWPERCQEVSP